jgi:uncharacterized protein YcbX
MRIGTIKEIWRYPVKSMAGERLRVCSIGPLGVAADRGWALRDEHTREITNGKRIPLLMQSAARFLDDPANGEIPQVEITLPDRSRVRSNDPQVNLRLSQTFGKDLTLWPRQPASNKEHYRRAQFGAQLIGPLSKAPGFRPLLRKLTSLPPLNGPLRDIFSREQNEPIPDISLLPTELLEFTSPPGTYFDAFPIHVLTTASLRAMEQFDPAAAWDIRRFRPNLLVETDDSFQGLVEASWIGKTVRVGEVELKCEIPAARCGMTMHAQQGLPKEPSILRSIVKHADQNLGIYASVTTNGKVAVGDSVEIV